ncbi:azurin [Pseudomonas sp. BN515]|uniref:azurin n=1 Tax=Pseudomonas sp. BN515 TaxID=2567892 RepID=UPI002455855C|nr:azurin [Pseudomonas sp. BN515]MDH4874441.1 azurin [Pseudomonas sp. BN515]
MLRPVLLTALLSLPSAFALGAECQIDIGSTDQMTFTQERISISRECKQITLTLTHHGRMPVAVMGHNWVLAKASDVQAIATDGINARASGGYLKPGDERVIAHTKLIGGGESTSVSFEVGNLTPGESYAYFCSFPGHWAAMKGTLELID